MKKYLVIFALLLSYSLIAQNYTSPLNERDQEVRSLYVLDQANKTFLGNDLSSNQKSIYLRQIGDQNLANIIIESSKSNINVLQKGNENEVQLNIKAVEVNENIVQIGDNNLFIDYNRNNNLLHQLDVYQKGENQKIILRGTNSLTEKIKIRQLGNDKTIYINSK